METLFCSNNCCSLKIEPYSNKYNKFNNKQKFNKKKAGVLLYDSVKKKILIVQSRGRLWGLPKGTLEEGETFEKCAVRELLEETGINVNYEQFNTFVILYNSAKYFFVNMNENDVKVQDLKFNDANGIGWIKIDCILKLVHEEKIKLNRHAILVLKKILNVNIQQD